MIRQVFGGAATNLNRFVVSNTRNDSITRLEMLTLLDQLY